PGGRVHGRPGDRAVAPSRRGARRGTYRAGSSAAREPTVRHGLRAGRRAHLGTDQVAGPGRAARERAGRARRLMAVQRLVVVDRARFLRRPEPRTVRVLALVGLVVLWEAVTRTGWVSSLFLPAPSGVLAEGYEMARSGHVFVHLGPSLARLAWGFGIGPAGAHGDGAGGAAGRGAGHEPGPLGLGLRHRRGGRHRRGRRGGLLLARRRGGAADYAGPVPHSHARAA